METPFDGLFNRLVEEVGEEGDGGEAELRGFGFRLAHEFRVYMTIDEGVGLVT